MSPEKEEGKEREVEEEGRKEQWSREELALGLFAALGEMEILLLEPVKRVREAEGIWVLKDLVVSHWGDVVITDIEAIVFSTLSLFLTFLSSYFLRATQPQMATGRDGM